LGRFLRGEPTRARPLNAWRRPLRWARRRPAAAAVAAVLGLGAVALAVTGVSLYDARLRATTFERLSDEQKADLEHGRADRASARREQRQGEKDLRAVRRSLGRLEGDLRAAHRTLYVADVRQARGDWERYDLGAMRRRLATARANVTPDFAWHYLDALT